MLILVHQFKFVWILETHADMLLVQSTVNCQPMDSYVVWSASYSRLFPRANDTDACMFLGFLFFMDSHESSYS